MTFYPARPLLRVVALAVALSACLPLISAQTLPAYDYWPNPVSHTNSDAWLREHHSEIKQLRPKVLLLIADNKADTNTINYFVKAAIAAAAEGSRYHGYSDKTSLPQLAYRVAYRVDLRDSAETPWPRVWPVHIDSKGRPQFSYDGLFTPEFAAAMNIPDPEAPGKLLNVRELFEHGLIHEVWMVYPERDGQPGTGIAGAFETTARVQVYDKDGQPVAGKFRNCGGNGCFDPGPHGQSTVTMRFAELNIGLGVGCFVHATGHGWDTGLWRAIPEFDESSARFFNRKLNEQGLPLENLYDTCSYEAGDCWEYPNDHTITNGPLTKSLPFKDDHWGMGCGSVHFPPNGRHHDDYDNAEKVLNTCENYGFKNGKDGADLQLEYNSKAKVAEYERLFPDCGGGWQVYMRQSFPGYCSAAKNEDGTPMKSWWPYLYY
jgi:hypothetical protein